MNKENKNSYNHIAKATSLFGGVQIFTILISIIRTKFIAILLGVSGIGLIGLFNSTTGMILSFISLGINFSAVRTISISYESKDIDLQSRTIITLRRWTYLTGLIGAFLTLIFAKYISTFIFGSEKYWWAFIFLSITIFTQSIIGSQQAILQGVRKLKQLAKANVLGSFFGLCISVPLYYFFGMKGIIPSIILSSIVSLILLWNFVRKIIVRKVFISIKESFFEGIDMVKLGTVIMITNFSLMGVMYLVQIFISRIGGIEQVGLYVAATTIITGYIGLIFSSMLPDFLPRLSAVSYDSFKTNKMVNQQTEIVILVLGPILIFLLSCLPIVIKILYNSNFFPIMKLIQWAIPGILFMAVNWTSSIMLIAKGEFKIFLIIELFTDILILLSYTVLYNFFQLEGIGIASLFSNTIRFIIQLYILHKKYSFSFEYLGVKIFVIQLVFSFIAFLSVLILGFPSSYLIVGIIFLASTLYSFIEIRKRIDFSTISNKW